MKILEVKLSEFKKHSPASRNIPNANHDKHHEEFIGLETESEDESMVNGSSGLSGSKGHTNSELDARLSRLALLDKTQQEIDQISVATESMLQQSPGKFYRISSQNLKLPANFMQPPGPNFDTLNSIGSENGSLSDIHTER